MTEPCRPQAQVILSHSIAVVEPGLDILRDALTSRGRSFRLGGPTGYQMHAEDRELFTLDHRGRVAFP
jgi:hypothetical protein